MAEFAKRILRLKKWRFHFSCLTTLVKSVWEWHDERIWINFVQAIFTSELTDSSLCSINGRWYGGNYMHLLIKAVREEWERSPLFFPWVYSAILTPAVQILLNFNEIETSKKLVTVIKQRWAIPFSLHLPPLSSLGFYFKCRFERSNAI